MDYPFAVREAGFFGPLLHLPQRGVRILAVQVLRLANSSCAQDQRAGDQFSS
jgi:hypothetical protein